MAVELKVDILGHLIFTTFFMGLDTDPNTKNNGFDEEITKQLDQDHENQAAGPEEELYFMPSVNRRAVIQVFDFSDISNLPNNLQAYAKKLREVQGKKIILCPVIKIPENLRPDTLSTIFGSNLTLLSSNVGYVRLVSTNHSNPVLKALIGMFKRVVRGQDIAIVQNVEIAEAEIRELLLHNANGSEA